MSIFPESPLRDKQIKFYVSEEERNLIQEFADSLEISVSELLRRAVNDYAKKHRSPEKGKKARKTD